MIRIKQTKLTPTERARLVRMLLRARVIRELRMNGYNYHLKRINLCDEFKKRGIGWF